MDVDEVAGAKGAAEIERAGGRACFVSGDVASAADVRRAVETALERHGRLDLLWSNAGIGVWGTVTETSEEEWDRIVDVNLKGSFLVAKYGIPELVRAGGGTMVITASISSFVGARRWSAYCATKGGLLMLCRAMALDYASQNVRVNCVCPASIDTPLQEADIRTREVPRAQAIRDDQEAHPLGRYGTPEEVARTALFLSCDDSSFTTGSAFPVDGGYLAQ